jgi:hypothetical protein
MRRVLAVGLVIAACALLAGEARAEPEGRCATRFPEVTWTEYPVVASVTVATSGLNQATSERFAADAARNANRIAADFGGLDDVTVCITDQEARLDLGGLVARGQRLHVGAFGAENMLVISAVEIGRVSDGIAFGLADVAAWNVAADLGLEAGYPQPLAGAIGHWFLARDNDRLDRYHAEMVVNMFLDNPNPDQITQDEETNWTSGSQDDPFLFDPQFVASPIGDFIQYAVAARGSEVLHQPEQAVWGPLERDWRISLKEELLANRQGQLDAFWGIAIVAFFVLLTVGLAVQRRRQKLRSRLKRPTPPPDETLFGSDAPPSR